MPGGNGGYSWATIWKWQGDGSPLLSLNPPDTQDAPVIRDDKEPIVDPNFIDIDGDGTVDVVEFIGDHARGPKEYVVYRLTNNMLVPSPGHLVYFDLFARARESRKHVRRSSQRRRESTC